MNVQEQLALIEALRLAGATHYKSDDFEITLNSSNTPTISQPAAGQSTLAATALEGQAVTEKLKDLISTLNMTPEQLANQIFPNGAE
jgi:hypothetical protein